METAPPESIIRPLYMLLLSRSGPGLTSAQINYIAESKVPGERDWSGRGFTTMTTITDRIYPVIGPAAADYLSASGLIARSGSSNLWKITDQGASFVQGAMGQPEDASSIFILDPEAPLDYHSLLSELDSLEDPLVVDAYFHPHDFGLLAEGLPGSTLVTISRSVAKVEAFRKPALSEKLKKSAFEEVLAAQGDEAPKSKVVYVPSEELHDRYFLGSNGMGYFVGGSFRSGKPTVAMKLDLEKASELYSHYRKLVNGDSATPLEPKTVPVSGTQKTSDA